MTPDQRTQIINTAKYLRAVRPLDPTEFTEYITDHPSSSAIRAVLRDNASALKLVEHPNGTFTPPPDGPIRRPHLGPITKLPDRYSDTIDRLLADEYGPAWYTGDTGETLRQTIRHFKDSYFHGTPVTYTTDTAFGYALYHFPGYYAAIQYTLYDLLERHLLSHHLRVLDVGAGTGAPAIGLHDLLYQPDSSTDDDAIPLIDYHAIEPSAATTILTELLATTSRNFHTHITETSAEAFTPTNTYDLIIFANILSELDDPTATVTKYAQSLTDTGSIVLLAPADQETSTHLRTIERSLTDDLTVYSPTIRLWPNHHPTDSCWSFDTYPDLDIPPFQHQLDQPAGSTGEFVNADVKFSYVILRSDAEQRITYTPPETRFAKLTDTPDHVTDRINCAAIKLSRDLGDDRPVYLIGDGSQHTDHYAVLAKPTAENQVIQTADYGDLLLFQNVLVLWNDDETAYNLVIDDTTYIDHIGPSTTP